MVEPFPQDLPVTVVVDDEVPTLPGLRFPIAPPRNPKTKRVLASRRVEPSAIILVPLS